MSNIKDVVIPEGWKTDKIKDITSYVDYRGKTPTKVEEGVFLVTAKNIKGGIINYKLSQEYIKYEDYSTVMSRGIPKIGDVLFTTEAPMGEVANVDKENIALAQRIIKFRGKEKYLNNYYLKYSFTSGYFSKILKAESAGSTVEGIKGSNLHNLKIIFPQSLQEQEKIAEILSTVDEAIEKTDALIDKYKKIKTGLMEDLFTKGIDVNTGKPHTKFKESELGRIPESWEIDTFGGLLNKNILSGIQDGNHGEIHPKSEDFVMTGVPFVMASDISSGKINFNTCKFISNQQYNKLRIGFSQGGDVLLSHKASIGFTSIVPDNINIMLTPQVTYYRINKGISNKFLMYYFQSNFFQNMIKSLSAQSTRSYIGITAQKDLHIKYTGNIQEQEIIAEILSEADKKIEKEEAYKEKLEKIKKGLMNDLLTGAVRVKY